MSDNLCYAISSGEYSDYSVHVVFERETDARAFLIAQGFEERHGDRWPGDDGDWWKKTTEAQPDPPLVADDYYGWDSDYEQFRIEPFQFWPAGVVPHASAA